MYTSDTSDIWIARSVNHEKKTELQVSLTPKKGPILCIQWNINLSNRGDGSYFTIFNYQGIIKAKEHLPARTLYRQEKKRKTNIKFVMYCIKINFTLVQVYSPFTRKW